MSETTITESEKERAAAWDFARRLKAWRAARGIRQSELLARTGVPGGTWRNWEQARRAPTREHRERLERLMAGGEGEKE